MIAKSIMEEIKAALARLNTKIEIIEHDCLNIDQLVLNENKAIQHIEDSLYLPIDEPAAVLTCSSAVPGGADILMLAAEIASLIVSRKKEKKNQHEEYKSFLLGKMNQDELNTFRYEYQLPEELARCIIVL